MNLTADEAALSTTGPRLRELSTDVERATNRK